MIVAVACGAAAQQAGPLQLPQAQKPLKVRVEMVHLFATVRGKHNALISNLTKDNFRVFEDGQPQKIAYFSRAHNQPVVVGFVLDLSS